MSRKTFSVDTFKQRVNTVLADGKSGSRKARQALIVQLEAVLHDTGNYNGFRYLTPQDLSYFDGSVAPGINMVGNNLIPDGYEEKFAGTDDTRVTYF